MTDSVMKDGGGESMEEMEELSEEERQALLEERMEQLHKDSDFKNRKRQVTCAKNLRTRIQEFVDIDLENDPEKDGKIAAFVKAANDEAAKIVQGPQGDVYCQTIGFSWETCAEAYLGDETSLFGLGGHLARSKQNVSAFGGNMKLVGAGIKAISAASRAMTEAEQLQKDMEANGGVIDEQHAAETMEAHMNDSLPAFLEVAWAMNKRDIQKTLKASCQKLFDDASVPKSLRLQRAEAVRLLGHEFHKVGVAALRMNKSGFSPDEIKAQLNVAAMTTMAKAQGQEMTEEDQKEMLRQAREQLKMGQQAGGGVEAADTTSESKQDGATTET